MRASRFTALALAFGVGAAGAAGADAAFAQDDPAPQRRDDGGEADRARRELERLLEELLPNLNLRRPALEERAKRQREMAQAQRDFERRMADMDRRFAQMRKKMEEDLRRLFGGSSPFGPGGLWGEGSPFGRGGTRGNSSRSFELGPNGISKATVVEGDTTITGHRRPDGILIEVTQPGPGGTPQTTVYRAENEADFAKKHPDQKALYERLFGVGVGVGGVGRGGGGFRLEFGPFGGRSQPGVTPVPRVTPERPGSLTSTKLGFTADPLSGLLRAQLHVPAGQGIFLKSVLPGGWAERAGLEARDVLLSVGGAPLTGVAALEAAISGKADTADTVALVLHRQGVRLELGVPK